MSRQQKARIGTLSEGAIRGGGGNFGIITAFEFQAHPVGMVVGGAIFYDAADGEKVLRGYADYAADDNAIDTILRQMNSISSPFGLIQLRVLGGAMARVRTDATEFAHRRQAIVLAAINVWMDPIESPIHHAWVDRFYEDMRPYGHGVYVNFLGDEGEARIREAYTPATYARLAALKNKYDPTNIFNLNQNIKPTVHERSQEAA